MKRFLPFILFFFVIHSFLKAQTSPPDPCDDGTQETCQCETSPVLCTIDDLDGFQYSMSDFQHPQDGPDPLCGGSGVPNNPTWFSFVAWCEELELLVEIEDCSFEFVGGFPPFTQGVQIAIYEDCDFNNEVACNVNDCGNENDKTLVMSDLQIGLVYHFVIDGCAGSDCDSVTINVIGTCGDPEIDDWINPVDGPELVCVGDPANYVVDQLDGANLYHWYVDGVEVGTSEDPNFDIDWDEEGTFELCVDASNDPCIPVTDDPGQICLTVEVFDPSIGDLIVDPNPLCPGEVTDITVIDANDNPALELAIIVTDRDGIVEQVDLAEATTFTYPECETFIAYAYQYIPSEVTLPAVGDFFNLPDCSSSCCELLEEEFSFEDDEAPTFLNPPDDEMYECINLVPDMEDLEFEDNCLANGFVEGEEDGAQDVCDGGTITRTWTVEDSCGNIAEHIQTITVDPLVEADWVDPPANETVDCNTIPTGFPDLDYTNGSTNPDCEILGTVSPVVDEDIVDCEGTITATWTFTDSCDRTIEHVQVITVDPPALADWIDPPANETVSCADAPDGTAPFLSYDNGQIDDCEISGDVEATVSGSSDECGGSFTYEWTFTDDCNRTISHIQEVTVEPASTPDWIDPPASETLTCDDLPLPTPPDLEYTNGETGDCEISGIISPTVDGSVDLCGGSLTYTWDYTDSCGNSIAHSQTITVDPVPEPDWVDPPANETLTCDDLPLPTPPDLEYTNGETGDCEISGTVSPTIDGTVDLCGGSVTYTWEFTDACGNFISYTQEITVDPVPEPDWVDPPANETLTCDDLPLPTPPDLEYTNGESGDCEISGTVTPTVDGTVDFCGGSVTYTWDFTDVCGNSISHSQTITVEPVTEPDWVDPPANMTLTCDDLPLPAPPDLEYTNGETGDCEISGTVAAVESGDFDECGGTITYTWNISLDCDVELIHEQQIEIEPAPEAEFIDPPANVILNCNDLPLPPAPDLNYSNGETGVCEIAGAASPSVDGEVDACGGTLTYSWTFTDNCDREITHVQVIEVEPTPQADWVDPPSGITLECNEAAEYDIPDLEYGNGQSGDCEISGFAEGVQVGTINPCGGTISFEWTYTDDCDRTITHSQTVNVTPAPAPAFTNVPDDIEVTCTQAVGLTPPILSYDNGEGGDCSISGTVAGTTSGSFTACGGNLVQNWSFTDACGRSISASRNVTVLTAPAPDWINPPGNITVSCVDVDDIDNSLSYTNNNAGNCLISGTVTGVVLGSYDACGGTLTQEWSRTDACGNVLSHTREITVEPAPSPDWVDPPADVTLDCGEDFSDPVNLAYDNGELGDCGLAGTVAPTVSIDDINATYTWTYVNPCDGSELSHTQVVTLTLAPEITIEPQDGLICFGDSYDLTQIIVTDANDTDFDVTYHTNTPATTGNEILNPGNYSPASSIVVYVKAAIENDCSDEAPFVLIVEPQPEAGDGGTGQVCDNETNSSLPSFLIPPFDAGGSWGTPHNQIDISNPNSVNFSGLPGDDYTFYYIVPGAEACPPDTAEVIVTVLERPTVEILEVECTGGNDFYSVRFSLTDGAIFFTNAGDDTDLGGGEYIIENIPINSNLIIDAILASGFCPRSYSVNAPDCNCPNILHDALPIYIVICEGEDIPALSVVVDTALYSVNWLDAPGGEVLQSNSLTFTPTESEPGIYTYYTQTYDLIDSCTSNTFTEVSLEIIANPEANQIEIVACGEDGFASFSLSLFADSITGGINHTVDFYLDSTSAVNEDSPLTVPFENTESNSQQIFARVTRGSGCFTVVPIDLRVTEFPISTIDVQAETCSLDSNGQITITPEQGTAPFSYNIGNGSQGDSIFTDLVPGNYNITVLDANGCEWLDTIAVDSGQVIDFEILSVICNDNGTSVDSTDDFYTVELLVTSSTGTSYTLQGVGLNESGVSYGQTLSFELDADGENFDFTITDDDTNCNISGQIQDLVHCSSDCQLIIDQLSSVCNDAGTSSDPSDDFYEIEIVIAGVNVGSNGEFIFRVNGVIDGSYSYGDTVRITRPANGGTLDLNFSDSQITACVLSEELGPLDPCSDDCSISVEIVDIICDDAGTLNDESDDIFDAFIVVSGVNLGNSGWEGNDGSTGDYGDTIRFGSFLISDGDISLQISDVDDPTCVFDLVLPAPEPCSEPCELDIDFTILDCDNNGTGADETDDFFGVEIVVTVIEGPGTRYRVVDSEGNSYGPFDYGDIVNISPLPSNGETITLTVTDDIATQCTAEITVSSEPCSECNTNLTMGPDPTLTCDITEVPIFATAAGALNIRWEGPNNFTANGDTAVVDASGTYIATAEFEDNCFITDSLEVLVDDNIPTAVAGPDGLINCLTDSFVLQNLSGNTSESVIVEWRDAEGNIVSNADSFVVFGPGEYELRLIDTASNCISPVERVRVGINTHQPNAVIFADPDSIFDCTVRTIILSTDAEENVVYSWQGAGGEVNAEGASVNVFNSGIVTLLAIDTISLCSDTATINLEDFDDFPRISIAPPDELNCRDSSVLIDASDSYFSSDIQYDWFNAQNDLLTSDTNQILVSESGWYFFRSTDVGNDCVNEDSVFVSENLSQLDIDIEGDTNLPCGVNEGSLQLVVAGSLSPLSIDWTTINGAITSDRTSESINFEGEGIYEVEVLHPESFCPSSISTNVIASGDLSLGVVEVDSILCFGEEGGIRLQDVQGTPPIEVSLNGQAIEIGDWVEGLGAGEYTLEALDANGCSADTTIILTDGVPIEISLEPTSANVDQGETVRVEVQTNLDEEEIADVFWTPPTNLSCTDCLTTTVTAISDEEYEVTITDIRGCFASAIFRLLVRPPKINIFIPNIFTPNGDGVNDGFTLFTDSPLNIDRLMVFDRWGNKMFETRNIVPNDPMLGWNGRYKGQLVNPGVYVYSFQLTFPDGTEEIIHGDITVNK